MFKEVLESTGNDREVNLGFLTKETLPDFNKGADTDARLLLFEDSIFPDVNEGADKETRPVELMVSEVSVVSLGIVIEFKRSPEKDRFENFSSTGKSTVNNAVLLPNDRLARGEPVNFGNDSDVSLWLLLI
jgi:hypothetical protein